MRITDHSIYKYNSYEEYVKYQCIANSRKLSKIWVQKDTVDLIVNEMAQSGVVPKFGLCHGTRRGVEQQYFLDHFPNCEVLGTEIAYTGEQFTNTIIWDFHNIKEEWIGACDFIYSNSLDHAYDPKLALNNWIKCLNDSGRCFIEWWGVLDNEQSTLWDPFVATPSKFLNLVEEWAGYNSIIVKVIPLLWNKKKYRPLNHAGSIVVIRRSI